MFYIWGANNDWTANLVSWFPHPDPGTSLAGANSSSTNSGTERRLSGGTPVVAVAHTVASFTSHLSPKGIQVEKKPV